MAGSSANTMENKIDALVAAVKRDPETVMTLTEDELFAVRQRLQPYAFKVEGEAKGQATAVIASTVNLTTQYAERLAMTAIVGFLGRLVKEHEPPAAVRRWQTAPSKAEASAAAFDPAVLAKELREAATYAESAAVAHKVYLKLADSIAAATTRVKQAKTAAATAGKSEAALADIKDAEEAHAKLVENHRAVETDYLGGLAAATIAAAKVGGAARERYAATLRLASRQPEVRRALEQSGIKPESTRQLEVPVATAKAILQEFFDYYFSYDPINHVRPAADGDSAAELKGASPEEAAQHGRISLNAMRAKRPRIAPGDVADFRVLTKSQATLDAARVLLGDPEALAAFRRATADDALARWKDYLVPVAPSEPTYPAVATTVPQDSFFRLRYYTAVNYEALRRAAEAAYCDFPELDWTLAIWRTLSGSEAENEAAFRKFCEDNESRAPTSFQLIPTGHWVILSDVEKNRERIAFYNKNTKPLEKILDRISEDSRMGKQLLNKRVHKAKASNIAENGPDAPGLSDYASNLAAPSGAERIIGRDEMKRLNAARGDLRKAAELKQIDEIDSKINEIKARGEARALSAHETSLIEGLERDKARALEMLEVPDDAVQIDQFVVDAKTGTVRKEIIYTEAEAPPDPAAAAKKSTELAPHALAHLAAERKSDDERKAAALTAAARVSAARTLT